MTYARGRLWIGISGVGSIVILCLVMVITSAPAKLFPTEQQPLLTELGSIVAGLAAFVVMMTPFDFIGGYLLPRRFQQSHESLPGFLFKWSRGVLVQSLFFAAVLLGLLAITRQFGIPASIAAVLVVQLLLLAMQASVARLVSGLPRDWTTSSSGIQPAVDVLRDSDRGFTGGIAGLPGLDRILVPATWRSSLSSEELNAIITRRKLVISSGSRLRGIMVAIAWNTAGFAFAAALPGSNPGTVAGLVTIVCYFTLFSFVGLLLLPVLSRRAVAAADQLAVKHGISASVMQRAVMRLDQLQDDEPSRSPELESVFHPVPCATRRMFDRADEATETSVGAWNAARMTLFLSWAGCGLLSRAVHCNAGRPTLWVLLPAD